MIELRSRCSTCRLLAASLNHLLDMTDKMQLPAVVGPTMLPADDVSTGVPAIVADAGRAAQFAWDEFFSARIRNAHTRDAYSRAVRRFFAACEEAGVDLRQITPGMIGRYLDGMSVSPSTKKLHLAALRHFFDCLVERHVVVLNPAASVRGERHAVVEGKTPEIGVRNARRLLTSIVTDSVVGLRDRAIVAVLIYTAARVGAVAKLRVGDFYSDGAQFYLRFTEKRGKSREIPVRHDLQLAVRQYLDSVPGTPVTTAPLFRTAIGRTGRLSTNQMTANDMGRMLKRRFLDAGLSQRLTPHSFRVTTITDLLEQGVPMEDVQNLAGHADPRTTRLYDRRDRRVTRNIVERISI